MCYGIGVPACLRGAWLIACGECAPLRGPAVAFRVAAGSKDGGVEVDGVEEGVALAE